MVLGISSPFGSKCLPVFFDALSHFFDTRKWNISIFTKENDDQNENDFNDIHGEFLEKIKNENALVFYEDLNKNELLVQVQDILSLIYKASINRNICWKSVTVENHIIDQWKLLYFSIPPTINFRGKHALFSDLSKELLLRLMPNQAVKEHTIHIIYLKIIFLKE